MCKKTIKETRDWLLENRTTEFGSLDLEGLDFSEFDSDVFIRHMKVKGDLFQDGQEVGGDLYQQMHCVKGDLHQNSQEVKGEFYGHKLKDNEEWECREYYVVRVKNLKKITREELAEMGYEIEE